MLHRREQFSLPPLVRLGIALGLVALAGCDRSETAIGAGPAPAAAAVQLGTKISFGEGGNAGPYKVSGWSTTEAKFTWTEGSSARLKIPIAPANDPISIKFTMAALVKPPELPFQPVEVYVNDQKIAEWQVGTTAEFAAAIPASITKPGGDLTVEIRTPKATSPKSLGLSADPRVLGICCLDLELAKS
jgi:hypothetical protein